MVFGFIALRQVGVSREMQQEAYSIFTYLKGMHGGLQSVPLAVMTGIDLLTGGGSLGLLVKVTSLGLSIFSVSFTCVIYSSDMHGYSYEKSFDFFMLTCFDMIWMIVAFGWVVGAFNSVGAGVAIGIAYFLVFAVLYALFWHTFHPCDHSYLHANLLPYIKVFGWPESYVDDVLARKRAVAWVLPLVCLINSFVYGATPYIFDLEFFMPQPGAKRIKDGETLAAHLSVTRRVSLIALCILHLVKRYSALRMALTIGTIAVHSYFSLRMWDRLTRFGVFQMLKLLMQPVVIPLSFVLKPFMGLAEQHLNRRRKERDAKRRATTRVLPQTTRPLEVQLSGQEAEFFDMCDKILDADRQMTESQRMQAAAYSKRLPCFRPRRTAVPAAGVAKRLEVVALLKQASAFFAASCRDGSQCTDVDLVTGTLEACYMASVYDVDKLEECCAALKALLSGTTHELRKADTQKLDANVVLPAPPLYAVAFRTVADAFVWEKSCDTGQAFQLAQKAPSVNYFCSHSWGDDAAAKAAVLRTFLFMQSSVAVTLISTFMFTITFIPGGFIINSLAPSIPWWAMSLSAAVAGGLVMVWGIISHVCGLAGFVPWRWCGLTFWLDKCCIDQRTEASKQAGIAHLGDSLEKSECMLVIFSEAYLERLWCTYELARYCTLIRKQEEAEARGEKVGTRKRLLFLSLSWSEWWNPATWMHAVELSADEKRLLANYRCREAKFWKRADQEAVLRRIREEWSEQGSEQAGEDLFDTYVQTKLPDILLQARAPLRRGRARALRGLHAPCTAGQARVLSPDQAGHVELLRHALWLLISQPPQQTCGHTHAARRTWCVYSQALTPRP